jgi:hypothetical protein
MPTSNTGKDDSAENKKGDSLLEMGQRARRLRKEAAAVIAPDGEIGEEGKLTAVIAPDGEIGEEGKVN